MQYRSMTLTDLTDCCVAEAKPPRGKTKGKADVMEWRDFVELLHFCRTWDLAVAQVLLLALVFRLRLQQAVELEPPNVADCVGGTLEAKLTKEMRYKCTPDRIEYERGIIWRSYGINWVSSGKSSMGV